MCVEYKRTFQNIKYTTTFSDEILTRHNSQTLFLKLVRTPLNYHVLGTSTAAIFLSNDHSFYVPIISDERHA